MKNHITPPSLPDATRRDLIKGALSGMAGVALAPGLTLIAPGGAAAAIEDRPADEPAKASVRWALLVDTRKCSTDCDECVKACNTEMGLNGHGRPETDAQYIRKVNLKNPDSGHEMSLPVMCQHCANPPCVDVCPTGASMQRADHIVQVDKHICIGCRYCMMACPYKARSFVHEALTDQNTNNPRGKGCVESCNFCVHRVDEGRIPACVEACNKDGGAAMVFGDLNDPDSEIAKRVKAAGGVRIREDLNLNTGVYYQGM